MSRRTAVLLALLLAVVSSSATVLDEPGVFSVNGFTDPTLSYVTTDGDLTFIDSLGVVANVVRLFGDSLYVVHSGDYATGEGAEVWFAGIREIEVAIEESRSVAWDVLTLPAYSNPWDVLVEGGYAYVSLTGSGAVVKLELATGDSVDTITGLSAPQGLAFNGAHIGVAESGWGDGTAFSLIEISYFLLDTTLAVGDNPQWAVTDSSGAFAILCSGRSWGDNPVNGAVHRYDPATMTTTNVTVEGNPGQIALMYPECCLGPKLVLGDEYAFGTPHITAYDAVVFVEDTTVPDTLLGGYSVVSGLNGVFIGNANNAGQSWVKWCSYEWDEVTLLGVFDTEVVSLCFFDGLGGMDVAEQTAAVPDEIHVSPAWPNPFNSTTTLTFELRRELEVRIDLFSVEGRVVRSVASGRYGAGVSRVVIDAEGLAGGAYFAVLRAGTQSFTRKLVLVR